MVEGLLTEAWVTLKQLIIAKSHPFREAPLQVNLILLVYSLITPKSLQGVGCIGYNPRRESVTIFSSFYHRADYQRD